MRNRTLLKWMASTVFVVVSSFILLVFFGALAGKMSCLACIVCGMVAIASLGLASYMRTLYDKATADELNVAKEEKRKADLERIRQKQVGYHI